MTHAEIEQEIIDMLGMSFPMDEAPQPGTTLEEAGLDSLDVVQAHLLFEDRWGEDKLSDYRPEGNVTIRDMAAEIKRRIG